MSEFTEIAAFNAAAWRDAAVADGWTIRGTYEPSEGVERAATLEREGFKAQVISRLPIEGDTWARRPEGSVNVWGPDGLAVAVTIQYDWAQLQRGLRRCNNCGNEDVDVERFSFAGRCCKECLPEMRRQHEYPGWTS